MNLTPEQMDEAVAVARRRLGGYSERQDERWRGLVTWESHDVAARDIVEAVATRLFAAWQEQTAAKAGEVGAPVEDAPGESILRESCVWFEDYDDRNYGPMVTLPDARRAIVAGAAAGVAASEARVRSEAAVETVARLVRNPEEYGHYEPSDMDRDHARLIVDAIAALLSEEPSSG